MPANQTAVTATLPIAFQSINTARIVGNGDYTGYYSSVRAVAIKLDNTSTISIQTNAAISGGSYGIAWHAIGF